jgi:hypothetical protein
MFSNARLVLVYEIDICVGARPPRVRRVDTWLIDARPDRVQRVDQ